MKATRFATDIGTPPPTYPEGRRCKTCNCILSVYNEDAYCAPHIPRYEYDPSELMTPQMMEIYTLLLTGEPVKRFDEMSMWQWNSLISRMRGLGVAIHSIKGYGHVLAK